MVLEHADTVVLGAGIAGCALAYHLAGKNVGAVVVYDPRTPAAGATGRAAGVVTEQLWNEWDVEVARASKNEYAQLAARWDPSAFTANGFARFTAHAAAAQVLVETLGRLHSWNVDVRAIGAEELTRAVPWARLDDLAGAIYSPHDAVVTPSSLTEIYAEGARSRGADVDFGAPFRSLEADAGAWRVAWGTREVRANRVVVAAGAWSKKILANVHHPLPLAPYRTQAAVLRPPPGGPIPFPSVHDIDLDVYVRPEDQGRILAGDGTELVEVDPDRTGGGGDETFLTHLAETFETRFPGWAEAELVRAWAGVCTSTPDRRPFVGPMPEAPGLNVLTGFNGFGVMRAGGVAQRLAAYLGVGEGATAEREALRPVLPERFPPGTPAVAPRPGFTLEAGDHPRF
ncbi:MAG: FAD-binding oxidoreductase [Thermoplasmata archaeon]|nr:FAD-binding oxidoreductase [Thermoplasmata archaeon]